MEIKRKKYKTIDDVQLTVFMQYVLEHLIECYDRATMESDKYLIQLELCDFVKICEMNISKVLMYMMLQEEKFGPFISILKDVKQDDCSSKFSHKREIQVPVKVKVYSVGDEL